MKLPIIIDNFVDEESQNIIEDRMFDYDWKFVMDNTNSYVPESLSLKYKKFLNIFEFDISPSIISSIDLSIKSNNAIYSMVQKTCKYIDFDLKKISRCIAGIQGVQIIRKKSRPCGIHINQETPHLVLLYYVNDSDGDTIIYDKTIEDTDYDFDMYPDERHEFKIVKKITPKRGRILLFDGRTYHASSSPTTGIRCIITLDLFGKFMDGSYEFPPPQEGNSVNKFTYQ
jgi:hypothetical protein